MPDADVMKFLLTRRSHPARSLSAPWPGRDDLEPLLVAAARSPDHGKLEPWRFIVLQQGAMARLAALVRERGAALGHDSAAQDKAASLYESSGLAVVVVSSPVASAKIPVIEQTYSAGAVSLALLNAALAADWGANWISGWASHDRGFVEAGFGLSGHEHVAGIIHIGTATAVPPERPRPDMARITSWLRD